MLTAEMSQLLEAWFSISEIEKEDLQAIATTIPLGKSDYQVRLSPGEMYVQISVIFPSVAVFSEHGATALFADIQTLVGAPINLSYEPAAKQISATYFALEEELEEAMPTFLSMCSRLSQVFDHVGKTGTWDSGLIFLMLCPRLQFERLH